MSIGILIRLATERASLRHCDKAGLQVEIHVSYVDLRPNGHIVSRGSSELAKSLGGAGTAGFSVGKVFCEAMTRGLMFRKKTYGFSLKFSGKLKPVMHYPVFTKK